MSDHFDAPTFNRWLKRYGEAEGLVWTEVAEKAGMSRGTMYAFVNGPRHKGSGGEINKSWDPTIGQLASLAAALDLDLSYVLTKAGIAASGDRMVPFSIAEREVLHEIVGLARGAFTPVWKPESEALLEALHNELRNSLPFPSTRLPRRTDDDRQ